MVKKEWSTIGKTFSGHAIHSGPLHDGTRAICMKSRLSALYKAIRRLLTDHCVCVQVANPVCVERDVEGVLRDFLCSPYENGSFWSQSTGSDLQLFGSGMQHEDNLFGPRLGCIRAFLNAVYEDYAYVAYNSRSVRLQEAGFVRTQLEQAAEGHCRSIGSRTTHSHVGNTKNCAELLPHHSQRRRDSQLEHRRSDPSTSAG